MSYYLILFSTLLALGCSFKSTTPHQAPSPEPLTASTSRDALPAFFSAKFSQASLSYDDFSSYLEFDPVKGKRCALPSSSQFKDTADFLGGFHRNINVRLRADELLPNYVMNYRAYPTANGSMEDLASASKDAGGVEVQRADLVAQSGALGVYLSKKYGIIGVDTTGSGAAETSCIFALPGTPDKLYWYKDHLIVLINGREMTPQYTNQESSDSIAAGVGSGKRAYYQRKGRSALLVLKYNNAQFTYVNSLEFDNTTLLDSRRFNSHLALYLQVHSDDQYYNSTDKKLVFVDLKDYSVQAADIFSNENPVRLKPEDSTKSNYFSNWLSASDQYLVVHSSVGESSFVSYENRSYRYCTTSVPVERTYCHTDWKRILNPDYIAPVIPDTYNCGNDLRTCLTKIGPTVAKYISVRDGQSCRTYSSSRCTQFATRSYDYPTYSYRNYTKYIVYRYMPGQGFIKLSTDLFDLKADQLVNSQAPITTTGSVSKHSHMRFQDGYFYALSGDQLSTFTFSGNSLIKTSILDISAKSGSRLSAAYFDKDKIVVDYRANRSGDDSSFTNISLAKPYSPIVDFTVGMPGYLNEFISAGAHIIGMGSVLSSYGNTNTVFQKIQLFDGTSVSQLDNVLLGEGGSYSYTRNDDQSYKFDPGLQTLFMPYYSNGPKVGIATVNGDAFYDTKIFEMDSSVERFLLMSPSTVLTFAQDVVGVINTTDSAPSNWTTKNLVDYKVPTEVYGTANNNFWISHYYSHKKLKFTVNKKNRLFAETPSNELIIAYSAHSYCVRPTVHYGGDYLVIELPDETKLDCSKARANAKVKVYEVTSEGVFRPLDDKVAVSLLAKMKDRQICYVATAVEPYSKTPPICIVKEEPVQGSSPQGSVASDTPIEDSADTVSSATN